jgi:hypothetical protein
MYGYNLGLAKARVSESVPAAPANVVQPLLVGNGAVGSVVTCNPGAWSGSPSPTFTFNFKLDTVSVQSGASNTYTPLIGDDTKTLTCTVTATNTEGSANADTSNSLVIGTAPANTVAPVISGTNTFGSTLTTTNGTFTGTAPLTYTYQWLRGGSPISGETSSTYVIGSSDSLAAITCEVKATNSYGFDSEVSNTITVQDFAPINTAAPTVSPSGTQSVGTLITANIGTWTGVAPITYEYKWTRNGVAISGATASTYTIQLADDGTTIRVEVKGTNTYGTSAYIASSNSVSAVNTVAPTNSVAPVISGTSLVGEILTTTTGTWSGIPTPTYSYQWKRGVTNIGTNATTYTLVAADAGQSITCVVTATNAGGSANATSNALSIYNSLLDVYPSASSAYSIRLLRAARYNNALLRVRRSSDNAEVDVFVDTNYQLSLSSNITSRTSGTTLGTWAGANSAFVTIWYDQSGNNNNATQTTAANQPSIVVSGVLQTNLGKAALQFSGTTNFTATVNWTNLFATYTVARLNSLTPAVQSYFRDNGSVNSTGVIAFNSVRVDTYRVRTSVVSISQTNSVFGITTKLITLASDATTGYAYLNNTLQASNAVSGNVGTTMYIAANGVGNTGGIAGPMSEWITYPSNSNLSLINTSINTFYGIY